MNLSVALLMASSLAYESVDPFWGSGGTESAPSEGIARTWNWEKAQTGNTHPGAVLPFGWASACAYTGGYTSGYGRFGCSGTESVSVIDKVKRAWGFTHFQHSGVGWIGKFYNYFLFVPYALGADLSKRSRLDAEVAHPGYYGATLTDYGTRFELAPQPYAMCHRYGFTAGGGRIRIDLTHCGIDYEFVRRECPHYSGERLESHVVTPVKGGWNGEIVVHGIRIYFAVRVKGSTDEDSCRNGVIDFRVAESSAETAIGFSLVSEGDAVSRADKAIRLGFDAVCGDARKSWEDVLGKVEASFSDKLLRNRFYSALYHSLVKPCDTGNGYVDFSTFWDIYKTELPLIFSLSTGKSKGIVEHILATIEKRGFAPICQIMDDKVVHKDEQATAIPLFTLCDAYFRGVCGKADYGRIKRAFEKELAHADISGMSPTHALDLSGACAAAARVAAACGDDSYAEELLKKASVWKTVYDPSTGMLPTRAVYYEGNHWNYSFRPHPGMNERVELAGGSLAFSKLLDDFFGYGEDTSCWHPLTDRRRRPDHFEGLNNECDMDSPFAYYWCGRVDRTAEIVDLVRRCRFANGEGGCPGNNDSGATSSWYVWSCLGLYPLTGTPYYLLATPSVDKACIRFARGDLVVSVKRESIRSIYPSEFRFNEKDLEGPWIRVDELERGGRLEFRLTDKPRGTALQTPRWL